MDSVLTSKADKREFAALVEANRPNLSVILKDPKLCTAHAINTLQGRFAAGERVIVQDAEASYFYATRALHERFIDGEAIILTNAELREKYAENFNLYVRGAGDALYFVER